MDADATQFSEGSWMISCGTVRRWHQDRTDKTATYDKLLQMKDKIDKRDNVTFKGEIQDWEDSYAQQYNFHSWKTILRR